ncbi:pyridoxamine 5'-phosphate oxidase family protein [Paraflavitalea pollutisoli]|uniref:pyridoxamine 5'-phosphate oxidase family protein n=1 Tax=Paraflavitalea pollutisoli TaxID=3034143 RepID=UPI0023EDF7E9|nr:pyridoxamine 5'-phosphate oxidase family protein [Paraflavitalea sp. H1-2-19X]
MIGNLTGNEIEAVLLEQQVGHLGCHADDLTLVVPISYAYDGTYIYGHTREGLKVGMMRKNPRVCFEVDILHDMANWRSVITWGTFEELTDTAEREAALTVLVNRILPLNSSETTHLYPQWPFPNDNLNDIKGIVFRLHLTSKTGRYESNSTTAAIAG